MDAREMLDLLEYLNSRRLLALKDFLVKAFSETVGREVDWREALEGIFSRRFKIKVEQIIKNIINIDKNGRFIPDKNIKHNVCYPNKSFCISASSMDCSKALESKIYFPDGLEWPTLDFIQQRKEVLLKELEESSVYTNLLNGPNLLSVFPKMVFSDYGQFMREVILPAVEKSYPDQFTKWSFNNYLKGDLAKKVQIVSESHQRFIQRLSQGPNVGIQFFPYQGFSVLAAHEHSEKLPNSFCLSGPIDIGKSIIDYPETLVKNFNTPSYDCSAVLWWSVAHSLRFGTDVDSLGFDYYDRLGCANDTCSSGILFLGSAEMPL